MENMKRKILKALLLLTMSAFVFVWCSDVDGSSGGGSSSRNCSACNGTGYCDRCGGWGEVNGYVCNDCYGDAKCYECGGKGYK